MRPLKLITGTVVTACLACGAAADGGGRNVIIKYKEDTGRYEAEHKHNHDGRSGIERPHRLKRIKALAGYYTEDEIAELAARPDIEYIEDDVPVMQPERFRSKQFRSLRRGRRRRSLLSDFIPQPIPYGINMTQADRIAAKTDENGDPIMSVCVIDSGLDDKHEDIQKRNVMGASFGKKVGEWNHSFDPHGTHVAGTLAALGDNRFGVVGVESAGNLRLLIARVFDDVGSEAKTSFIVEAAEWCADQGANVINLSLGNLSKVKAEGEAMADLWNEGVLLVAAAGNDGLEYQKKNYPASFDEVISVGMVGENGEVAADSQQNSQVEIVAPGVTVLSTTITGTGELGSYTINGTQEDAIPMEFSVPTTDKASGVSGVLIDCGYGEDICPSSTAGQNHVCLIKRGAPDPKDTITFVEKLEKCEDGGGVAAIIYNHLDEGPVKGTLTDDKHGITIPAVGISKEKGEVLKAAYLNQKVTAIVRDDTNYTYMTGTSMASPLVAGAAAVIWSHHPHCSNAQIRKVLQMTADKKRVDGDRDDSYGFGLLQAKEALDFLDKYGCPDG
mmetsp:Transcript_17377/g.49742  ORF Transcript_17377/g.49742 Transcript_17377/m.49742 type:complete len:558 (+) Transcript_17377:155-1828(+)|eukprot:CAMPEP_0181057400 /NCGR_PEP_ID=MMETSP1070-20121207/20229_1 /TAXON_ID=265543 /ORGANISM="Minutocellus polymorphus, Strain NH13" /LENGTH=557 /DNA_ID=CAMNT_0023136809 /DNA_START=118 /DNA_END=1791 /DNA_ORIENTATION=+